MIVDIHNRDGPMTYIIMFARFDYARRLYIWIVMPIGSTIETIPRKDIVCFTVHLRNKMGS